MDIVRQAQVDKIRALKQELKRCKKNTPHWRDIIKCLYREQKELLTYDKLRCKR